MESIALLTSKMKKKSSQIFISGWNPEVEELNPCLQDRFQYEEGGRGKKMERKISHEEDSSKLFSSHTHSSLKEHLKNSFEMNPKKDKRKASSFASRHFFLLETTRARWNLGWNRPLIHTWQTKTQVFLPDEETQDLSFRVRKRGTENEQIPSG